METIVWTIVSSSLVSAIVSALIAGRYSLRAKENEYINEYYRTVVQRRVLAYEYLERLIVSLKTAVLEGDRRPYHILFSNEDAFKLAYELLGNLTFHALWLSDEAFEKTRDLNYRLFRVKPEQVSTIDFGKENYEFIAGLRSDLERIVAKDMLELHAVERFLKAKQKKNWGFRAFDVTHNQKPPVASDGS